MAQENSKSYLLWYHSNSHQIDRFYTGIGSIDHPLLPFTAKKPTWTKNKDEAHIFSSLEEATSAKNFCEECQYSGLQIEPIDNVPLFVPSETVTIQ